MESMLDAIQAFLLSHPLVELGLITGVLVLSGVFARALKQPVLVGYILAGLLMSPQVLDMISHYEQVEVYAHLGVSLLLFMVGLGLSPSIIREVGKVSALAGVGQVVFTSLVGYVIAIALGFDMQTSLYIAIALTFSSTIVIVKLISDRGDSTTVYGKIALGILIVQDIIAMMILMYISATTMHAQMTDSSLMFWLRLVGSLGALTGLVYVCAKYVLPAVMRYLSRHQELVLLFVVTRALLLGGVWYFAGFSMEIGALLAGVALANSPYRFHIMSELRPLRDFFVALFFVYLGSQIIFDDLAQYWLPLIIFSVFVLVGNPLIVMWLMGRMGYARKIGFMTGLTVAQISEFSFVVIALAVSAGHITQDWVLPVVTVIGLITMTGSSYFFAYAEWLYNKLDPYLHWLGPTRSSHQSQESSQYDVVVIGYNRIGTELMRQWVSHGYHALVIDHDPARIRQARSDGYSCVYAEVSDVDVLPAVVSDRTQWICSTVQDYTTTRSILRAMDKIAPQINTVVLARDREQAQDFYTHGASYVVVPHAVGADHMWSIVHAYLDMPDDFHENHAMKSALALDRS